MSKKRTAITLLAAAVSASPMSSAYGTITFNLIGLSTLTPNAQAGFQAAANRWSSALDVIQNGTAANITLNISVGFTALDSGVIAQTNSVSNNYWYTNFRSALSTNSNSANDATALANLPTTSSYGIYINHTSQNSNSATPYVFNASTVNINRADRQRRWGSSPATTPASMQESLSHPRSLTTSTHPTARISGAISISSAW